MNKQLPGGEDSHPGVYQILFKSRRIPEIPFSSVYLARFVMEKQFFLGEEPTYLKVKIDGLLIQAW